MPVDNATQLQTYKRSGSEKTGNAVGIDTSQNLYNVGTGTLEQRGNSSIDPMDALPNLEGSDTTFPYTDLYGNSVVQNFDPQFHGYSPLNSQVNQAARDLPLYSKSSTVTFGPFASLHRLHIDTEWPRGTSFGRCIQYFGLNRFLNGIWQSDKSLLPYLLNSPYSPIYLDLRRIVDRDHHGRWKEAFEDLLLASAGQPLHNSDTVGWCPSMVPDPLDSISWLLRLENRGLLQSPYPSAAPLRDAHGNPLFKSKPTLLRHIVHHTREKCGGFDPQNGQHSFHPHHDMPSTEEDMYDNYFNMHESTQLGKHVLDVAKHIFGDQFIDLANNTQTQSRTDDDHRQESDSKECHQSPFSGWLRTLPYIGEDFGTHIGSFIQGAFDAARQYPQNEPQESSSRVLEYMNNPDRYDQESDQNRVVATTKRVHRFTQNDGSIMTNIETTRVYADGKEHTESSTEVTEAERGISKQTEVRQEKDMNARADTKKRGWFWT